MAKLPRYWYIIIVLGGCAFIALFLLVNPSDSALFPKCPVLHLTGIQCPGCGSQRAIHSLLHFNIIEAWKFNPLMVSSLPYLLLGFYLQMQKRPKAWHVTLRKKLYGLKAIYIVSFIVVTFTILRNVF